MTFEDDRGKICRFQQVNPNFHNKRITFIISSFRTFKNIMGANCKSNKILLLSFFFHTQFTFYVEWEHSNDPKTNDSRFSPLEKPSAAHLISLQKSREHLVYMLHCIKFGQSEVYKVKMTFEDDRGKICRFQPVNPNCYNKRITFIISSFRTFKNIMGANCKSNKFLLLLFFFHRKSHFILSGSIQMTQNPMTVDFHH